MNDAALSALYQEMILDHYRRPRNKGVLDGADVSVPMSNPMCADEITLELSLDGDHVSELRFTGHGCSISQASTSMMTELVKGKSTQETERLCQRFRAMVMGDRDAALDESLGKTRCLSGVARFPARVRCALLGWNALEQGLARVHSDTASRSGGID